MLFACKLLTCLSHRLVFSAVLTLWSITYFIGREVPHFYCCFQRSVHCILAIIRFKRPALGFDSSGLLVRASGSRHYTRQLKFFVVHKEKLTSCLYEVFSGVCCHSWMWAFAFLWVFATQSRYNSPTGTMRIQIHIPS